MSTSIAKPIAVAVAETIGAAPTVARYYRLALVVASYEYRPRFVRTADGRLVDRAERSTKRR